MKQLPQRLSQKSQQPSSLNFSQMGLKRARSWKRNSAPREANYNVQATSPISLLPERYHSESRK
jgi:hypothetical protein